jgi:hydrogenase-1 operon protein HyaF
MTEKVLVWHPKVPSDAGTTGDDELRLIGMPTGLLRPARQSLAADQLTAEARALMHKVLAELYSHAEEPARAPKRFELSELGETDKATVADILGEGDVWAKVGNDGIYFRVVESVLPGVWRLESSTAEGTSGEWIEVGAIPQPILTAAREQPRTAIDMPENWPQGAMNAPALLTELQERSSGYEPGSENHVINFTLLPLTETDAEVLTGVLGQIPLIIRSGGYGSCRMFATDLRHVWAVQYLNSMDAVILDTLEVGGVPVAALAATEDFEDSAERLAEILEAYTC